MLYMVIMNYIARIADLEVAFMHASNSVKKWLMPPKEWRKPGVVWKVTAATNGLQTASADFQICFSGIMVLKLNSQQGALEPTLFFFQSRALFEY